MGLSVGDELTIEARGGVIIIRPRDIVKVDDVVGLLGSYEVDIEEIEKSAGKEQLSYSIHKK